MRVVAERDRLVFCVCDGRTAGAIAKPRPLSDCFSPEHSQGPRPARALPAYPQGLGFLPPYPRETGDFSACLEKPGYMNNGGAAWPLRR